MYTQNYLKIRVRIATVLTQLFSWESLEIFKNSIGMIHLIRTQSFPEN